VQNTIIVEAAVSDCMIELTELTQPRFYQAIGVVEGILDINDPNNALTVGDRSFAVTVANAARKKHQPQSTIPYIARLE
jgi:hypothetical protein